MSRIALVTGGTRGIGAATARLLKESGYRVAATYAGRDDTAQAFREATGVAVYRWDVSDPAACQGGVEQVEGELGPLDVLVNNAG
ncbi:MAG TPA: SDR family NAD(P)-dependent oxidoreductase, partial [Albitalea sp.]